MAAGDKWNDCCIIFGVFLNLDCSEKAMRSSSTLSKKQLPGRTYESVAVGVCGNCPAACGLKAYQCEAETTAFFGDEDHPMNKGAICPKGLSLYGLQKHPRRLVRPRVRENAAEPWREASWDAALDFIAERLAGRGGPDDDFLAAFPCGLTEPFDYAAGAAWFASLLPSSCGPERYCPPALGRSGAPASMFGLSGGRLLMNPPRDWAMSRTVLLVGGDVAAESPISFGPLEDARDRGSTLLYIGSAGGMTALRATETMTVLPGAESVALACVVRGVLSANLTAADFVAENVVGVERLAEAVKDFSPEAASAVCGAPVAQLERFVAILGASFPIQAQIGFSERLRRDESTASLCGALTALRGCIGVPGGGLNMHAVSPFRGDASVFSPEPGAPEDLASQLLGKKAHAVFGFGDFAARLYGGKAVRTALAACPLVVRMGPFDDDETSRAATVSLPTAHWSEYEGLVDVSNGRTVQWRSALCKPLAESRTPLDVWTELAGRLKAGTPPPWKNGNAACETSPQRRLAAYMLASEPATKGLVFTDLIDAAAPPGGLLWPSSGGKADFERSRYIKGVVRGQNILFEAQGVFPGSNRRFLTEDGKIHLEFVVVPSLKKNVVLPETTLFLRQEAGRVFNQPCPFRGAGRRPVARMHPETASRLNLSSGCAVCVRNTEASLDATLLLAWSAPKGGVVLDPEAGAKLAPLYERDNARVVVTAKPAGR